MLEEWFTFKARYHNGFDTFYTLFTLRFNSNQCQESEKNLHIGEIKKKMRKNELQKNP